MKESIKIKANGIEVYFHDGIDIEKSIQSMYEFFDFKTHKYLLIQAKMSNFRNLIHFLRLVKEKIYVFVIVEIDVPDTLSLIEHIYAAGCDFVIFHVKQNKDIEIVKRAIEIFPDGAIIAITQGIDFEVTNLKVLKKVDINSDDFYTACLEKFGILSDNNQIFESLKRKIWLDISNLRRTLKVREVEDSFASSGL